MKILRKYLSLVLCLSLSVYSLPSFSGTCADEDKLVKVELTDSQMAKAVGGSGSVDANLADYKVTGGKAEAVMANRSTLYCNYTLDVINTNGQVVENLASGTLEPNQAIVASGVPTDTTAFIVKARLWNSGVPGLESIDTSWKYQ